MTIKNTIHPFTSIVHQTTTPTEFHPKRIVSAQGIYVTDDTGRELLDAMAGLWCVNVGYGRKELADEAQKQLLKLPYYHTFYGSSLETTDSLSIELSKLTQFQFTKFFFCNSGSESIDSAIKLAHYIWKTKGKKEKKWIISRENAYHGSTIAATAVGGMSKMKTQLGNDISFISHISHPFDHTLVGTEDERKYATLKAEELEKRILELGPDNVAAFIAEPFQGAGGVMIPNKIYWEIIPKICKKYDVLLIADEVIGGFGRLGTWFAYMYFGFKPDLFTFAKGLTSGYLPMGGVAVSQEIVTMLDEYPNAEFQHGFTYSGHPVCAAVALKNLRILQEENILEHVRQIAPYFKSKLIHTVESFSIVGSVSTAGLVAGIQLLWEDDSSLDLGRICREEAYKQGLIMRAVGRRLILSPPLIITKTEIDLMCKRISVTLDAVTENLLHLTNMPE